jgi:glycosyltransferase involved in cell wall biosynthesis
MSIRPEISGIMAAHNAASVVGQAIESMLAQTFEAWELIIVDDGSTDETWDIVRAYGDPRIKPQRLQQNVGAARARNIAVTQALGRFLAIVDSDDISRPDRLELLAAALRRDSTLAVASGQVLHLLPDGTERHLVPYPTDEAEVSLRFRRGVMGVAHAACMIRRATFMRYGGYHEGALFAEDLDLFLRMHRQERFINLPAVVLSYRNNPLGVDLPFWFRFHQYHEYAGYRSKITTSAVNDGGDVLDFDEWRHNPWRCRRVYTRHMMRYVKHQLTHRWARNRLRREDQTPAREGSP